MTYNNQHNVFPMATGLGAPGAGFASRGKGSGLKRLQLATAPKVGSISENGFESIDGSNVPMTATIATPRTSRSHLLAGLRTQPRSATSAVSSSIHAPPASAPYHTTTHGLPAQHFVSQNLTGFGGQYAQHNASLTSVPHTSIGANFPSLGHQQHLAINPGQQFYALPEQVLAPPPLEIDDTDDQLDPEMVRHLHATELYLANRHQLLQQQIAALNKATQATQSFSPQTPVTPQQFGMFQQQQQYFATPQVQQIPGTAMVMQEVIGQPGHFFVYNQFTGQLTTVQLDQQAQAQYQMQAQLQAQLQAQAAQVQIANSPPMQAQASATFKDPKAAYGVGSPVNGGRSRSPPKKSTSPEIDVAPLPPPSANAFRRGHNRNRSSLTINGTSGDVPAGPKSAMVRPVGMPPTPLTGTFGPGAARAGDHPVRQPYGPPNIEELVAKPTTKFEGSKNFAKRDRDNTQRRVAINKLVRAGVERRTATGSASTTRPGSQGSSTPVSEVEAVFPLQTCGSSDDGSDAGTSKTTGSTSPADVLSPADDKLAAEIEKLTLIVSAPLVA